MSASLPPEQAWELVQRGEAELLDLRTRTERRLLGFPPGSRKVSLARHAAAPKGPGTIYLCQHAIRSKLTLRNGAAEVAGGFAKWTDDGLPVERER
jgi:rhodanese-related sulfurtransferase